jgi:hypothetical protein
MNISPSHEMPTTLIHFLPRRSLLEGSEIVGVLVSRPGRHQCFDGFDALDATSSPIRHAIDRGRGTGEVELPFQVLALHQAINKARVKDIACTRCINYRDAVCRPMAKLDPVPCQNSVRA